MFVEEAIWIKNALSVIPIKNGFQVLNVGSSCREFRAKVQPHIEENVFTPLTAKGCEITHLDMKEDNGVDLVLDLCLPDIQENAFNKKYDIIICCNILEHVADRTVFMANLTRFAREKGYILVTVPNVYFYHADPIDTMYRPTLFELQALLGIYFHFNVIQKATVSISSKNYYFFSRGRLLDYIPFRTHRHLWRYYFKYFRWKIAAILVEVLAINNKNNDR